eukprot:Hpha_TRINITY_DN15575_c2_g4::TRINITY_DN15575_c2_g4_i1::g.105645::m.105645
MMLCGAPPVDERTPHSIVVAGHTVTEQDAIKVLGVTIDSALEWEPHALSLAQRVRGAALVARKGLRGLGRKEITTIMRVLVLPILDASLPILAAPSERVLDKLRRAYHFIGRMAYSGRHSRTAPAFEAIGWPSWEDKWEAAAKTFAMRVWEDGAPSRLREELGQPWAPQSTRLQGRYELWPDWHNRRVGKKRFACWGREAATKALSVKPPIATDPNDSDVGHKRWATNIPLRDDPPDDVVFLSCLRLRFKDKGETVEDGRVVVWTDGSGIEHEGRNRAGAGLFYAPGHPKNAGVGVGGRRTAQRAELVAFVHVLRTELRPFEVRTDSRYVADGVNRFMNRWRRNAWYARPAMAEYIENADLWFEVDCAIKSGTDYKVVWVKGHGTQELVDGEKTTELDAWGNGGADHNAQIAARRCTSPEDVIPLPDEW